MCRAIIPLVLLALARVSSAQWNDNGGRTEPNLVLDLATGAVIETSTAARREGLYREAVTPRGPDAIFSEHSVRVSGGAMLVDEKDALRLYQVESSRILWTIEKKGTVVTVAPITSASDPGRLVETPDVLPRTAPWLVKTNDRLYRIDPGRGTVVWSAEAEATSPPLVVGEKTYETRLSTLHSAEKATVSVVVRDLATGAVEKTFTLVNRNGFFDSATATVVARRGGTLQVVVAFIILE